MTVIKGTVIITVAIFMGNGNRNDSGSLEQSPLGNMQQEIPLRLRTAAHHAKRNCVVKIRASTNSATKHP